MNLHDVLMEMSKRHQRIKGSGYSDLLFFNHKTKTISNGKTILVKDGKIIPQTIKLTDIDLTLDDDWGYKNEDFYTGMESRFNNYYESVPTKTDKFIRTIFPSKPLNKYLSYYEMMNSNCNKNKARYELEWFFMASSINKNIEWKNDKYWFWKSPNTKLIIYKEFI